MRARAGATWLCCVAAYVGNAPALVQYNTICSAGHSASSDVNSVPSASSYDYTPLMYAAGRGQLPCFNILVKNGADPKASCRQGNALHAAAAGPGYWFDCCLGEPFYLSARWMERYGTNALTPTKHVHSTTKNLDAYMTIIRKLLASGVDIDRLDANGFTPIMLAAKYKHSAALLAIAEHRPWMRFRTSTGDTVQSLLGMAVEPTYESIMAFLTGGPMPPVKEEEKVEEEEEEESHVRRSSIHAMSAGTHDTAASQRRSSV
ncbi:ankyrin repeat domain-containing protein [archaeon]|nr:MAG: ankyrin repeat domain-containing protein [archaeon]